MTRRRLRVAVGLSLVAAGVAFGLAQGFVRQPSRTYTLLLVGVVPPALVVLLTVGREWWRDGLGNATPPVPEAVATGLTPGDGFDDALATLADRSSSGWVDALRERLRDAAAGALVRVEGLAPDDARRRVDDGDWTDDGQAAAFLADPPRPTDGAPAEAAERAAAAHLLLADHPVLSVNGNVAALVP
ncbi:MAG: hypothetical protein ABEJ04_05135, partial [Halobacteriaceae archaeon]